MRFLTLAIALTAVLFCMAAAPAYPMLIHTTSGLPGPGVGESYLLEDTGHIVGELDGWYLFEDADGDLFWLEPEEDWIDDVMVDLFDHVLATGEEIQLVVWQDPDDNQGPRVISATRAP